MDRLPIADRNRIFTKDKDELMSDDPRFISAWIKLVERIIQIKKREQTGKIRETVLMETTLSGTPLQIPNGHVVYSNIKRMT
jgi:hypothetical protein